MKEEINVNIPSVTIEEFINTMLPMYGAFINKKINLPALMLWGPPGVGKSDAIKEIGEKLGETYNKTVNITDVRLLLYTPVDLRGIPTVDENKEFAKWLKPKIFQMNESENVINFLVLDEITAAPQSVQAAAYQITLDRQIGEHKLPDNCIIIAAGNRITDKSVAYSMPKALCNRMTHLEIRADFNSWKKWALTHGIDARVIGYITYKNSALNDFDPKSQDQAFPTPRSWEMVSNYLTINSNIDNIRMLIEGTIGVGAAIEFAVFCKTFNKLPDIKGIMDGVYTDYPNSPDVYYALESAIINYCINEKLTKTNVKNLIKYCQNMEAEYAILTMKDLINISYKISDLLITCEEWNNFAEKYYSYID